MSNIKKTKNFLKRLISLLCALFILSSCFIFPISATTDVGENDIFINYTFAKDKVWFPRSSTSIGSIDSHVNVTSNNEDCSILISPKSTFYDYRNDNSTLSHSWSVLNFTVTPTTDLSGVDFSQYDLVIDVSINNSYSYDGLGLTQYDISLFEPTLGITRDDILDLYGGAIPSINGVSGYDLPYETFANFKGDTFYNTYIFTDTESITDILDGSYSVRMPFANIGSDVLILYTMVLKPTSSGGDDTTSGNSPDDYVSNVDFTSPAYYDYEYPFNVVSTPGSSISKFSAMDFYTSDYLSGSPLKMRDYSNKFVINSLPVMAYQYDTLLGIGFADGVTYSEYFTDTVFDMFTVTLPARVLDVDGQLTTQEDMSLFGFRFEFYIAFPNGFDYSSYKEYLDSVSSYYYGCEPFNFEIGGVGIPYEYFKFSYDSKQTALRATLEFDGQNTMHRYYMNLIANNYSESLTLTFSLPSQVNYAGCMVGFTEGGYWQKYEETPIVPPDIPDTPTQDKNGGYTYDDLKDAYNKGLNTGRNENTNTNHVFGFFNGMFGAVYDFYGIIASGITIGGISVGALISSIVIICIVWLVVKRFI